MCDTIIPQQLTEITFEWFIFYVFMVILKYSYNTASKEYFRILITQTLFTPNTCSCYNTQEVK